MRQRLSRSSRALAWLIVAASATAASTGALTVPPPEVKVSFVPATATVGDLLVATIEVPAGDTAPRMPDWTYGWGDLEVVEAPPVTREADGKWRQRVTLRAFRAGSIGLPPLPIQLLGLEGEPTLQTPRGLTVEIRTVLPAEGDAKPEPPRPPRPLPVGKAFWLSLAVGLSGVAALALVGGRRKRDESAAAAKQLPPLDELVAALSRLPQEPTSAHVGLSAAFRRYLGRSLSIRAEEGSTPEIRRELSRRPVPGELARRAVDLLREIDGVKFARVAAALTDVAERSARAERFAREIEARFVNTTAASSTPVTGRTPNAGTPAPPSRRDRGA
jgi:hypothetical protein